MKTNELMIGDFVLDGNDYAQVTSITCDGNIETTHNEHSNIELIEPIPLTPEILEKNGWVRTKYCYGRDCIEIHGADELPEGVDNALSMARWSIDKNYQYHFLDLYMWKGSVMQHNVHYVHQLQHAFRIFGIEKEIIL